MWIPSAAFLRRCNLPRPAFICSLLPVAAQDSLNLMSHVHCHAAAESRQSRTGLEAEHVCVLHGRAAAGCRRMWLSEPWQPCRKAPGRMLSCQGCRHRTLAACRPAGALLRYLTSSCRQRWIRARCCHDFGWQRAAKPSLGRNNRLVFCQGASDHGHQGCRSPVGLCHFMLKFTQADAASLCMRLLARLACPRHLILCCSGFTN